MPEFFNRFDVMGRYDNQNIINTYFYREVLLHPGVDPHPLLFDAFNTQFQLHYNRISVDTCLYANLRITRFNDRGQERSGSLWSWPKGSARDVQGLPSGVTCVISRANVRNATRRFRGKLCIAAGAMGQTAAGLVTISSDQWAFMVQLALAMKATLFIDQFPIGRVLSIEPVIGNFRKRLAGGESYTWRPVGQTAARAQLGTQRHRLPGHGRTG